MNSATATAEDAPNCTDTSGKLGLIAFRRLTIRYLGISRVSH